MSTAEEKDLLAPKGYDIDAPVVDSDPDTDHEDVLNEAEEQEKLLSHPARFDAVADAFKKRDERRRRRGPVVQDGEVMFEMEGGYKDSSSISSVDLDWEKKSHKPKKGRISLVIITIVLLFAVLGFGAWKASENKSSLVHTFFNGTHTFKPTTILISLDGFRADFLNRGLTPALNAFIASGVSPQYMLPSFPSVTFPNHFTLVTGLYPESHGIVSNQFWDPELQEEFYYTDTRVSMQPKWWNAEPIWVTAQNQGLKTAIHMWPGSEAHISDVEPTYIDKFNESEILENKVDRLLHWLDMEERPQLMLAYVPNVDADGHLYGPNSTEIRATIADVDSMLTMIVEGLLARNLTEIVNLVVVSDHGMATTSTKRLIQLDDIIDLSLVDHIDGWPLRGLRLKNPERDVQIMYEQLLEGSKQGTYDVYTRETMPPRYHFSNNDRIAPLWVVPKTGWAVVERKDFDVAEALESGKEYHPKGLHGYDHEDPLMRAIFVARGPAFPHPPNSKVAVFQNTEVYNIVCDSIGIKAHPSNGTLHLPLKTEGLHSDGPQVETPHDAGKDEAGVPSVEDDREGVSAGGVNAPEVDQDVPEVDEDTPDDASKEANKTKWWKFLHDQLEKAKEWAKEFIDSIKGNKEDTKNG